MADSFIPSIEIPQADLDQASFETLAVRAGIQRSHQLEHSEAIFPTSSFIYNSAEEAAGRFGGELPGNIYSRFTNPTVQMFEARMAALEGAERAVATASGMAAIMSTCMSLLKQGDHVVCSRSVFGTTSVFFEKYLTRFGVKTDFVDLADLSQWQNAVTQNTRMMFLETPSNPLGETADLESLSQLAKANDALFVVDNCVCTPVLQQPFKWGADIVIHSATKYIDGQGRCIGGVVVGNNALMEEVYGFLRSAGPTLSPFNAWVFLKGLETLPLRMKAHSESALKIAKWLDSRPEIEQVFYNGLPEHPQHAIAAKQQSAFGGLVSFKVMGDQETAFKFINGLRFFSITANLGDTKSTVTHPATTTHGRISPEEKLRTGISPNLIRISVGLENVDDIIRDLEAGIQAAGLN
jgi:O-succinylhomoserine sulfhydrylase